MLYILIGVSLTLASLTGMQFLYMFYLDRVHGQQKIRLRELEKRCKYLSARLSEAESRLGEQSELIETLYETSDEEEEIWADVIDER